MDYKFEAPNKEEEVILKDLMPGEFFIFKDDYTDESYNVNLVCDFGRGIDIIDNVYNCLVLDLEDNIVRFEKENKPVVRIEPCEIMTFRKVK